MKPMAVGFYRLLWNEYASKISFGNYPLETSK
jgi:hypothetical protein